MPVFVTEVPPAPLTQVMLSRSVTIRDINPSVNNISHEWVSAMLYIPDMINGPMRGVRIEKQVGQGELLGFTLFKAVEYVSEKLNS